MRGLVTQDEMTSASVLAVALSDGRRRRALHLTIPAARFQTDGLVVYLPGATDRPPRFTTCGIALQCSPTKDSLAGLDLHQLNTRQRRALSWVEGEAALGWAAGRWPGLEAPLRRYLPEVKSTPSTGGAESLLRAAEDRCRRGRMDEPPALLGALPGRPGSSAAPAARATRRIPSRTPWTLRGRRPKAGWDSIACPGETTGELADAAEPEDEDVNSLSAISVGIPYDEWNVRTGRYRPAYVRVLETGRRTPPGAPPAPTARILLPPGPDRRWARRLSDGPEFDLDSVIDDAAARAAGAGTDGLVYAGLERGDSDVAFAFLIDASASVGGQRREAVRLAVRCAAALGEAVSRRDHRWAACTFRSASRERTDVEVLKDFADRRGLDPSIEVPAYGSTRLGAAVRHVTGRLLRISAERRVLVSLGDARPDDHGYEGRYATADVAKAVEEANGAGVWVHHLSVTGRGTEEPARMFGAGAVADVRSAADLSLALARIYARLEEQ